MQVPLADPGRPVARAGESVADTDLVVPRRDEIGHVTCRLVVPSGQQHGSIGRAKRIRRKRVGESHPLSGQRVDVRRLDLAMLYPGLVSLSLPPKSRAGAPAIFLFRVEMRPSRPPSSWEFFVLRPDANGQESQAEPAEEIAPVQTLLIA